MNPKNLLEMIKYNSVSPASTATNQPMPAKRKISKNEMDSFFNFTNTLSKGKEVNNLFALMNIWNKGNNPHINLNAGEDYRANFGRDRRYTKYGPSYAYKDTDSTYNPVDTLDLPLENRSKKYGSRKNSFFAEMAHAMQFKQGKDESAFDHMSRVINNDMAHKSQRKKYGKEKAYDVRGTLENEAHDEIEKVLYNEYLKDTFNFPFNKQGQRTLKWQSAYGHDVEDTNLGDY